jgi:hypothetical protein
MKNCIIGFNDLRYMPYMEAYINLLKRNAISFDYIIWDREYDGIPTVSRNEYKIRIKVGESKVNKLFKFLRWRRFVKEILQNNHYDKIIVLTTIPAVLLNHYLITKYSNKYLLDIRDYTYEGIPAYKKIVNKLVRYSSLTTISSEGFSQWLYRNDKIQIIHNLPQNIKISEDVDVLNKDYITIGYLGSVGYYRQNRKIVDGLKDDPRYRILFKGSFTNEYNIKDYCKNNNINNVYFGDKYFNYEKAELYKFIDLINSIYGSESPLVTTSVPNKLYDCIIYKKPILVSSGTYLAKIVEEFNLGISIDVEKENIKQRIFDYITTFDSNIFIKGCSDYLNIILKQQQETNDKIKKFISSY